MSNARPIRLRDWVLGFALLLAIVIGGAAFWCVIVWVVVHIV